MVEASEDGRLVGASEDDTVVEEGVVEVVGVEEGGVGEGGVGEGVAGGVEVVGDGVEDCTGSEFSFVVISGGAVSGAVASGAAASVMDCGTEAVGGGVRKSASAVVGKGGSGVARLAKMGLAAIMKEASAAVAM
jgi:hypothetical protein